MTLPDFESIMFPLLQFAKDGNEHSVEDAEKYLAKFFDLSEKERKKPKLSGSEPLFLNRLRWARLFLKKAGLVVDPKISYYQITEKGKQVLEEKVDKLNVKYLLKYNEFKKWHNKKRIKKIERKPKHWKPIRKARNFSECSADLKKALCILEKEYLHRREQILKDIKNAERRKKKSKTKNEISDADLELKKLLDNYSIEYDDWDATIVLAFSKIDDEYGKKYQECATKEAFFELLGTTESPERFSHYIELGLEVKPFYDAIKDIVLANGQLTYNFEEHSALMKFYVNYLPNSQVTKQAIEFWLTNWKEYSKSKYATMSPMAFGLEALLDYDATKYKEQIQEHVKFILSYQDKDGSFKLRDSVWNIEDSSNCI